MSKLRKGAVGDQSPTGVTIARQGRFSKPQAALQDQISKLTWAAMQAQNAEDLDASQDEE